MRTLLCLEVGFPGTRMWVKGKTYAVTLAGFRDGLYRVVDDLGHERFLGVQADGASFPMGTSGKFPFERTHTAVFLRVDNILNRAGPLRAFVGAYEGGYCKVQAYSFEHAREIVIEKLVIPPIRRRWLGIIEGDES